MNTYKVRLEGMAPMLFNAMKPEALNKNNRPPRGKEDEWEHEHFLDRVHNVNGMACWQSQAIEKMLVTACSRWGEKIKGKGQQTYTEYVKASLVLPDFVPVCPISDLVKDVRVVNGNPTKKGGGKVIRVRPCVLQWAVDFEFVPSSDLITKEVLGNILDVAGRVIGLSDYRPRFGRFVAKIV